MILLNFDLTTGLAKLASSTTIKQGAHIPVRVIFSAAPGSVSSIQVALGADTAAPTLLAYLDTFAQENDTTWSGVLDGTDSRLGTFMTGKNSAPVNLELAVTIDGVDQVAPNVSITVQPPIIAGAQTSLGTPTFYTATQTDTLLAAKAALTVAGRYRIKGDGTFQLWNNSQSKWHTLTVTGAAGAEVLHIAAGE